MLILTARLALIASLCVVVLQHAGVPIISHLYPANYGQEVEHIAAYMVALGAGAINIALILQRSTSRRTHRGFTFPTEMHALWATQLDELNIPWRYNNAPLCSGKHHLQIAIGETTLCAVVANAGQLPRKIANRMTASPCHRPKAILGNYAKNPDKGAMGWFQTDASQPWLPIPMTHDRPQEETK